MAYGFLFHKEAATFDWALGLLAGNAAILLFIIWAWQNSHVTPAPAMPSKPAANSAQAAAQEREEAGREMLSRLRIPIDARRSAVSGRR